MCTVTYIPQDSGFCLTSNRDEKVARGQSWIPQDFKVGNSTLLYPKDPSKNGTWILAKNNGDAVVLLNGAFIKHRPKEHYRKSRGLILLEIMESDFPDQYFKDMDLSDIEPFTLVLFTSGYLSECRWDGESKHIKVLDKKMEYIWSSSTLYDKMAIAKRNSWFTSWWSAGKNKSPKEILEFHNTGGNGDLKDGLRMNRGDTLKTLSITQIRMGTDKISMVYQDLENQKQIERELKIQYPVKTQTLNPINEFLWPLRRAFIRLFHWEYWPFSVVYTPIMPYWIWLGFQSGSMFFFNTSNPSIENGGFAMESKSSIYDILPEEYRPKTVLIKLSTHWEILKLRLKEENLVFPLIAKPNIGLRGIQVKKILDEKDLKEYLESSRVDFLLQEFIPYENEVGIFYYRIPGENQGHISGIVGKDFLTVVGDNVSTIEELIIKEPRYFLQLPVLKQTHALELKKILKKGETQVLVPYGNHARGSKFLDLSHLITDQLTENIHKICSQIPDFYYGRMDIMYQSWDELCEGKNLSIVELNGAGSEPTHIYDPKHSIFFAWKEITRHWKILNQISRINQERQGLKYLSMDEGFSLLKNNSDYLKLVS